MQFFLKFISEKEKELSQRADFRRFLNIVKSMLCALMFAFGALFDASAVSLNMYYNCSGYSTTPGTGSVSVLRPVYPSSVSLPTVDTVCGAGDARTVWVCTIDGGATYTASDEGCELTLPSDIGTNGANVYCSPATKVIPEPEIPGSSNGNWLLDLQWWASATNTAYFVANFGSIGSKSLSATNNTKSYGSSIGCNQRIFPYRRAVAIANVINTLTGNYFAIYDIGTYNNSNIELFSPTDTAYSKVVSKNNPTAVHTGIVGMYGQTDKLDIIYGWRITGKCAENDSSDSWRVVVPNGFLLDSEQGADLLGRFHEICTGNSSEPDGTIIKCKIGSGSYTTYTGQAITADTQCYFVYPSYNVTYNCGSGSGTKPGNDSATYNASFTPAANTCTAPTGYNFNGWNPEFPSKMPL